MNGVLTSGRKKEGEYWGEVVDGKKQGEGVLVSKYGDKYKGRFLNDLRHGEGA